MSTKSRTGSVADEYQLSYTVSEAAEMMRCSSNTVYREVARGRLASVRVGRLLLIPRREMERMFGAEQVALWSCKVAS